MGVRWLYDEFYPLITSIWGVWDAAHPPQCSIQGTNVSPSLGYFLVRPKVKYELTIKPWLVWK